MTSAPPHRLSPLLTPRSIAVVGASQREGSVGHMTLLQLRRFGFEGTLWPVNPKYREIDGMPCYPDVEALPESPDLAILAVPNAALEGSLSAAIAKGARAAALFASGYLEDDGHPPLNARLKAMAERAGIPVCGGNGMGFLNFADDVVVCGFPMGPRRLEGGAVLITHSGSVLSALVDCEDRIGYSLAVSTGNEMVTGIADYMDWALARPETTAIALFMETARAPGAFVDALRKAAARDVPVIALKVGRTEESARLAVSHSGALAGNDAAYRAVFERHGVLQVDTLDEMAATLALMTQPRRVAAGGLATMHDSGGERGMWIDLAARLGVPFARIGPATKRRLSDLLDFGLEPTNPLDAWGTGRDHVDVFAGCLTALAEDADTALAYFCFDREAGGRLDPTYAEAVIRTAAQIEKPVAIIASRHGSGTDPADVELARRGIPVIDGEWPALTAARHALAHRDFRNRPAILPPRPPQEAVQRMAARLSTGETPGEAEALSLLGRIGVPVVERRNARSLEDALAAALAIGFPVALKTAAPGVAHKTEVGGVHLDLTDEAAIRRAYDDLAERLGGTVTVAAMAPKGIELALGVVVDPDFGPIIMMGAGGTGIELYRDCTFLLAPFDAGTANRALDRLAIGRLLNGFRGAPAVDRRSICDAAAALSAAAVALADTLTEIDINPIIATPTGCVAVDALIVPRDRR